MKRQPFNPRLITPHVYSEGPKNRFTLEAQLIVQVDRDLGYHCFKDEKGVTRLILNGDLIEQPPDYSTDGCSPKANVFGVWVGTPDFLWTRAPSTNHDGLTQFRHCECFPLSQPEVDLLFYELMLSEIKRLKTRNAWLARQTAKIYYNTVRTAGIPFYKFGTMTKGRHGYCRSHQPTP